MKLLILSLIISSCAYGQVYESADSNNIKTSTGQWLKRTRTYQYTVYQSNDSIEAYDHATKRRARVAPLSLPISTATQTALNLKAPIASPTFTGTVSGVTATMVGLGNVTNESKATMFTTPTFTGHPTIEGVTSTGATGSGLLVFGTSPTLATPNLGTPSAVVLTNATGTAASLTAGNVTTNANLTGDVTSSGNATTIAAPSSTTVNNNTGGWVTFKVSGSDVTTTGQSLVDITGLVTGTLSASANYEIEAMLIVTTSAVTTGTEYGVNCTGTGTSQGVLYMGPTTVTAGVQVLNETGTNINNTAATPAMLTTASETGVVWIRGVVGTGTGSPTIAIRHLKVTSGTSTVKIGSRLWIRKM